MRKGTKYMYGLLLRFSFFRAMVGRTREKMKRLYPQGWEQKLIGYYCDCLGLLGKIFLVGGALCLLTFCQYAFAGFGRQTVTGLERKSYGEGSELIVLEGKSTEGNSIAQKVQVPEQKYNPEELGYLYRELLETLTELMKGKNPSLQEVYTALVLPTQVAGYPFQISWSSSAPEQLNSKGELLVRGGEEIVQVTLRGEFTGDGFYDTTEWQIEIHPAPLTVEEQWKILAEEALWDSDSASQYEPYWVLPSEVGGEAVQWQVQKENPLPVLLGLLLCCLVFLPIGLERELAVKMKQREKRLLEEYASIVTRLTLYLGAGMSTKEAWHRTAYGFNGEKGTPGALAEMRLVCKEMESGVFETLCYENFGKRCGLRQYIKLGSLLSQNLRRGNRELLSRLREETVLAQEQQRHVIKRKGEEIATKLLVPMMMLFGIVLLLIMIPAFTSLG